MLVIAYDLHKPGQHYADLIKAIEAYGNYAHILQSTWLIRTGRSAQQVYDNLSQHLDEGDRIFISGVQEHNQQGWLAQPMCNWVSGH